MHAYKWSIICFMYIPSQVSNGMDWMFLIRFATHIFKIKLKCVWSTEDGKYVFYGNFTCIYNIVLHKFLLYFTIIAIIGQVN